MRERLSFANVVSVLALFIALGGTGYAAFKLPKNSVGTRQLRRSAVTGVKVKDNSITGKDVSESTLGSVPSAVEAQSAGDAQTLDGRSAGQLAEASKLQCPPGTKLSNGVCFETATHSDIYGNALAKCGEEHRRLPTEGELIGFEMETFTSEPEPEWAEPEYPESGKGTTVYAWNEFAGHSTKLLTEVLPYRCVTLPSN